ncbi:MAG: hypothetical protein M1829_006224 [Trizodia sp. TS-e1964]|nr:MAG: hypothetical protein M1829_006224 [Trizodia sp. TS-e1964]
MSIPSDSNSTSVPWDPFTQSFTLVMQDGTLFNVSIPDLDDFIYESVATCINYGTQIGASVLLLVVLALLTKEDKRRSPIFMLNMLALALNFVRSLLQALYYVSEFSEVYAYFAYDYSRVPSRAYARSIASDILTLLLVITIQLSLIMQTRVVCLTLRDLYRHMITFSMTLVAFVAVAFRFALVVQNIKSILAASDFTPWYWIASATNIAQAVSICLFCAIFVWKLGVALHQRRKLGLRQFGPMQIIFIMGCQTLVIPAIFAILEYTNAISKLSTQTLTLVAIFLPLSSMWASASLDGRSQASPAPSGQRRLFNSSQGASNPMSERKPSFPSFGSAGTTTTRVSNTPCQFPSISEASRSYPEDDIEAQEQSVRVKNSFSVHHDEP